MVPALRTLILRGPAWVAIAWLLLALLAASGPPTWLHRLVPLQVLMTQALLPEFEVQHYALQSQEGQWRAEVRVASREFLVLRERVWAPGLDVSVHTPARLTQRLAVLLCLACALAAAGSSATRLRAWAWACAGSAMLLLVTVPVVLAGQVWSVGVDAFSEPTWRALLVSVSGLLLHGGDLLVAIVAPVAMVLSDHASAWFSWTMGTPSAEGPDRRGASTR